MCRVVNILNSLAKKHQETLKIDRLSTSPEELCPPETTLLMVHSPTNLWQLKERAIEAGSQVSSPTASFSSSRADVFKLDSGIREESSKPSSSSKNPHPPLGGAFGVSSLEQNGMELETFVSSKSWDVARAATGTVCLAVDRVVREEFHNAVCLVRPPGHHNTMVICATRARLYPQPDQQGTGKYGRRQRLVGAPLGAGEQGAAGQEGVRAGHHLHFVGLRRPQGDILDGVADMKNPNVPTGNVEEDYAWSPLEILKLAAEVYDGRVVSVIEGGYAVRKETTSLANSVAAHVAAIRAHDTARRLATESSSTCVEGDIRDAVVKGEPSVKPEPMPVGVLERLLDTELDDGNMIVIDDDTIQEEESASTLEDEDRDVDLAGTDGDDSDNNGDEDMGGVSGCSHYKSR
ncbi:hypothetical protein BBJ28_00021940 [Nothophytophthora sp. Chile5]|nr:hypothetical protein BBJ28_00021940 [Nothophytophthora sp. Chile5]